MESARDQCNKEGCRGCPSCTTEGYRESACWKCSAGLTGKPLSEYSAQEIRAELARRRGERRKAHANARTNVKIKALEKELERLKKELL